MNAAVNRRDRDALCGYYHPNVELRRMREGGASGGHFTVNSVSIDVVGVK
jgi:hypothetical protein